jgi:magnesium transporter
MLKTLAFNRHAKTFHAVSNPAEISDLCALPEQLLWVDVSDPTGLDFEQLAEEFQFHPLAIEDCRNPHQRPKVESYQDYYFIVLYEAELDADGQLELRELNLFLGEKYLVTVHSRPVRALANIERLWRKWVEFTEPGTGVLAYLLIDAIVDDYMTLLDQQAERIEDIEEQIFGEFQPESLQEIFRLRKQLLFLRRGVVPLRDVFNVLLRHELPFFTHETRIYFQDVFDHLVRVTEMIDALRDMLSATVEAYLSVSGHRMNLIMKRLTSISTILMSVTLVAGIYGMNFGYMPELGWRYGYVGALVVMLLLALCLYFYFRRIKWL